MESTIICRAMTADGELCGQVATVVDAQPVYASTMFGDGGGKFQHVVIETRYQIDCPACGQRTQIVPAGKEPKDK